MTRTLAAVSAAALVLAAAPDAHASPAGVASIPARAATQKGRFTGQFVVGRYVASGAGILATGRLQGRLRDSRYPSARDIDQGFSTFVTVSGAPAGTADCKRLTLAFAGKTVRIFGLRAAVAPRTVTVRPRGQNAAGIGEVLCAAGEWLAATPPPATPQPPPDWLLHVLNGLRAVDR
ncbi:hypothetical protein [Candidatus Solirubrobacter pratensis]|uniref:hypothetical protein n=1 Tax=Candidatus Solirubrobacter pratensis TaxID=1298857 RepID=UPI0004842093|nr:hypothetical protein [Candidatus Solirubrobacter pratensis]